MQLAAIWHWYLPLCIYIMFLLFMRVFCVFFCFVFSPNDNVDTCSVVLGLLFLFFFVLRAVCLAKQKWKDSIYTVTWAQQFCEILSMLHARCGVWFFLCVFFFSPGDNVDTCSVVLGLLFFCVVFILRAVCFAKQNYKRQYLYNHMGATILWDTISTSWDLSPAIWFA